MKRILFKDRIFPVYIIILTAFLAVPLLGNSVLTAYSPMLSVEKTVIIDPGHGGEDGGAVSCTGIFESKLNLEIALRLDDLMHLLGWKTTMIRTTDRSVYTHGTTIAAKKVSDIKERTRIVNTTPGGILVSIHQNYFTDPRYSGAQVFYNSNSGSKELAITLQGNLQTFLGQGRRRQCKRSEGVYLMNHINCPGILIECGFLSNPSEEALLRQPDYQKKLCCCIAATLSQYLNT